jgi:hypothetical protein
MIVSVALVALELSCRLALFTPSQPLRKDCQNCVPSSFVAIRMPLPLKWVVEVERVDLPSPAPLRFFSAKRLLVPCVPERMRVEKEY